MTAIQCGCAGGEVTTLYDEGTMVSSTLKRRMQKIYQDALGRTVKSEVYNWEGGSVYATVVNTYNALDQVTNVRQYAGGTGSGTFQDTSTEYDGYGRVYRTHRPEQFTVSGMTETPTYTTFGYNNDDTVATVTDGRGAAKALTYNNRRLVTGIAYSAPGGSGITVPGSVAFTYDGAGNRLTMDDDPGTVIYTYDQQSQLTDELRNFDATLTNAPETGNGFKLQYAYSIAGQLASVTDPYGQEIDYTQDAVGRLASVTGATAFGGVTDYADNAHYRAFGALKDVEYDGGYTTMQQTFNDRMKPATFKVVSNSADLMKKSYTYDDTGRLSFSDDTLGTTLGQKFDRSLEYDSLGRLITAMSGGQARGETATLANTPYYEETDHDALGHMIGTGGSIWTANSLQFFENSFVRNRDSAFTYDGEGHQLTGAALTYSYDAANRMYFSVADTVENTQVFDGDGAEVKRTERDRPNTGSSWSSPETRYVINSSVLGTTISETTDTGAKDRSYIYAGNAVLASQTVAAGPTETVEWEHYDASGMTRRNTKHNLAGGASSELDPAGRNVGLVAPPARDRFPPSEHDPMPAPTVNEFGGCVVDGIAQDCSMLNSAQVQCPNNDCGPRMIGGMLRSIYYVEGAGWGSNFTVPRTDPAAAPYSRSFRHTSSRRPRMAYADDPSADDEDVFVSGIFEMVEVPYGNTPPTLADLPSVSTGYGFEGKGDRSFEGCSHAAGLTYTGFNIIAAGLIIQISQLEGTAVDLLAVTWQGETAFTLYPLPNPNKTADTNRWDVGPMHVNRRWARLSIKKGELNTKDIDVELSLGAGPFNMANTPFFGDAIGNLRLGARELNNHGTGAQAAEGYVGKGSPGGKARAAAYGTFAPKYRQFFDCWDGRS